MPETLEHEVEEEIRDVVEPEDTEVAEPEVSEAEPQETAEDWRDDQIKNLAQRVGWNDATLDAMGSKEAVYAALEAASRLSSQFGGEQTPAKEDAPESASPEFPELPELDVSKFEEDDPSLPLLKQLHESNKRFRDFALSQHKELESLKQQTTGFTQLQQQQQELAQLEWFDSQIRETNPDVFGKDHYSRASAATKQARGEVYDKFQTLRHALPDEDPQVLFDMVLASKAKSNTKPTELREKRAAQIQGGRPPQAQPEDREAAYEALNRRILGIDK